jgi:hypothetical protein
MVVPYLDRAYRYRIESSTDKTTWRLLVDRSSNTTQGSLLDDFSTVSARYVRLTVVGVSGVSTTWASIQELAVYPPTAAATTTTYASDTFTRSVTSGFGTADTGGAWSLTGTASDFSVVNGAGRIRLPAAGAGRTAVLSSVSARDVDLRVDTSYDKAMTGGGAWVALLARRTPTGSNDYRVKVKKVPSGAVTLSIVKLVNGTETVLASRTISGLVAGTTDVLRMRMQVVDSGPSTISAKVWKTTAAEPAAWQVTVTDATPQLQAAGAVGVRAFLLAGATNAPVTSLVDNLSASSVP